MISLALFLVRFLDVFGSALNQQNVTGKNWWMVPVPAGIRSFCLYTQNALITLETIRQATLLQAGISIVSMWAAATFGTWAGMLIYERFFTSQNWHKPAQKAD